jgi:hypothetical protein
MAIKTKNAPSASKGSTARGTTKTAKSKTTKTNSAKVKPPKSTPKKASKRPAESALTAQVKAVKVKPEIVEKSETDITVPLRVDARAAVKPAAEVTKDVAPRVNVPSAAEPIVTAPADVKPVGDDTNGSGTARGPVKDVDVMLLGGKVIDLRPSEPEVKPKTRKKLQTLQWSPARRKYVAEYLADAQLALRLSDWEITLQFGVTSDPDGDTLATMTAYEDQRRATMRFGKDFFDLSPAEMRQTLIHEMLHCHMFAPHHNAERTVTELGGTRAGDAFSVGMTSMIELATDAIADSLAPFFPTFELPER